MLMGLLGTLTAQAQSSCSSDATTAPSLILERFINADCTSCWADPATPKSPSVASGGLALDWIVPGAKGDDAPLSAAASRDALLRLEALGQPVPVAASQHALSIIRSNAAIPSATPDASLRVARGVALGGYMGASIELSLRRQPAARPRPIAYPLTAWLVLAETIPAGADGSPVPRILVRNALQVSWNERNQLLNSEHSDATTKFRESRPMSLPEGSNPDKLRAVGWVQDATGRLITSAASVCR